MNRPIHEWKRRHDAIMSRYDVARLDMRDLIRDANKIISDLLKGGAECSDQDKRQIASRKKVKS